TDTELIVTTPFDSATVRERLGAIPGVEHVILDDDRQEAAIVLRADVDPREVEQPANEAAGENCRVSILYRPERRDRQRVRLIELQRAVQPDQQNAHTVVLRAAGSQHNGAVAGDQPDKQIAYAVVLEWAGSEYTGTVAGEKGDAVEMRTIASASLTAIAALVPHDVKVRLAGVKQVRAFDAELVVVSLYRPDDQPHN